jgi:hypothetical protein
MHRLSLLYSGEEGIQYDARTLERMISGERSMDHKDAFGRLDAAAIQQLEKLRVEFAACWGYFEDVVRRQVALNAPAESDLISRLQTFLDRRYALLYSQLKDSGDAGVEVLAHTFRQVREFGIYIKALQDDGRPGALLFAYDASAAIIGGRLHAFLRFAAKAVLSADTLGGSSFAASPSSLSTFGALPLQTIAGPLPVLGAPTSLPLPPPYVPPWPAASGSAAHLAPARATYAQTSPASGSVSTPASAAQGQASLAPSSEGRRQKRVTYADSRSQQPASGSRVKAEPGSDNSVRDSNKHSPFCGQPAHSWLVGTRCSPVEAGKVMHPECKCAVMHPHLGIGAHSTWDCPLRYIQVFGRCPGFDQGGLRDPRAWQGDQLTDATKADWVAFIRKHRLQTAKGVGEPDLS